MNIKASLEIFKSIWLIEDIAGLAYLNAWQDTLATGNAFQVERKKKDGLSKNVFFSQDTVIAPIDLYSKEAESFSSFDGARVVIIPVEGALMKNDVCGFAGTTTLLNYFNLAEKAESVTDIFLSIDSPGGTVAGTEPFAQAVANSKKKVKAVISGMCCSAAYWIASGAKQIFATSSTDIIGSIGTKIAFYDNTKALEDRGIILREFTATRSADKGKDFIEAAKGNGKLIIRNTLDPLNDEFLTAVQTARAGKINLEIEDVLTGKTYTARTAISNGLIDGIATFSDLLNNALNSFVQNKPKVKMHNFKAILQASGSEGVYDGEGNFFSLSEDELLAVDTRLEELHAALAATVKEFADAMAEAGEKATASAAQIQSLQDELTQANALSNALAEENTSLKDKTVPASAILKETDEAEQPQAKTSVDLWFATLNR